MMAHRTRPSRPDVSLRRSARAGTRWLLACSVLSIVVAALSSGDAVVGASRAATAHADAALAARLVGTWQTRSFGSQTLTNFDDGTASLDVELNRLAAIRYGRQMELQLEWTIENGVLSHRVVGGSPQRYVDRLTNDFGDSTDYVVVGITESELVLTEVDDPDSEHRWEAVRENE